MKSRLFSSMHTHTTFCDGKDDIETMCRAAYEKNLYAIGFSSHAPISRQIGRESEWNMKEEDTDRYVEEVLAAKERWKGKLNVFLGLEVDYIKGIRSPLDSDIVSINPDYIIAGVHYLLPENGAKIFTIDGSEHEFEKAIKEVFNGDSAALMHSYYDTIAEMIKAGGFDILAHIDIINKNNKEQKCWTQEEELERHREMANLLAGCMPVSRLQAGHLTTNNLEIYGGTIVEINTGGVTRHKFKDTYPSLTFLRIIQESNIPVIITADAHSANNIIGNYDIAVKNLLCANFKEHVLFKGKTGKTSVWQKEFL